MNLEPKYFSWQHQGLACGISEQTILNDDNKQLAEEQVTAQRSIWIPSEEWL